MNKYIFLLIIPVLFFISCDELIEPEIEPEIGVVRYEVNSESDYFHVTYTNEYGNNVQEPSYSNFWYKECEGEVGETAWLFFDEGVDGWNSVVTTFGQPVAVTISISFNGNTLTSYSGISDYESIYCELEN